jgi:outer membrane protein assembly factor BamB
MDRDGDRTRSGGWGEVDMARRGEHLRRGREERGWPRRRSAPGPAVYRRRRIGVGVAVVAVAVVVALGIHAFGTTAASSPRRALAGATRAASRTRALKATWTLASWLAGLEAKVKGQPGHLQPGSNPSVLPGPILIADRNNSRLLLVDPKGRILWQFPAPGDLRGGQVFSSPDDAFFGPHGRHILATQESQFTLTEISLRSGHVVWHYGHPGVAGSAPGYLDNPDDAMLLPNGNVMVADIKNCRLLELSKASLAPLHIYGETTPYCYHQPPLRFGSPNGMFPMTNGDWLVTEINGDWVDEMTPSGRIVFSTHPPGITYPSDTNEVRPGVFLTASYTKPGVVEEFNQDGQLLWRYAPSGAGALDEPSLALPLPNGDVLVNDDWNDRVIVVDPRTNKVVWQYGVTGVPGRAPGYLYKPDGVDLAPPYSLEITHASTMGMPPFGTRAPRAAQGSTKAATSASSASSRA